MWDTILKIVLIVGGSLFILLLIIIIVALVQLDRKLREVFEGDY